MRMRRLALLCLLALPAFGLTKPLAPGVRIGVIRMPDEYESLTRTIERNLCQELQARGFQSFDTGMTYDEMQRRGVPNADYYVEIGSSDAAGNTVGGVGTGIGSVFVDIAVIRAHVAAEVRLYDGRTLELVDRYDLRGSHTAAVPAGVGIGTRWLFASVALPFVRHAQYRAAAREIARDAADRIARR